MSDNKINEIYFSVIAFAIAILFGNYSYANQQNSGVIVEFNQIEKKFGGKEDIQVVCRDFLNNKSLINSALLEKEIISKVYNTIGWCYYNLKNIDEAISNLELALKSLDGDENQKLEIKIKNNLGIIYYSIGNISKSDEYFSETAKKGSRLAKDFSASITDINRANEAINYIKMGVSHRLNGRFEEAIASYTEAINLDPKNAKALHFRGYSFYRLEKYNQALEDLLASQKIDPNAVEVYVNLIKVYCKINPSMAIDLLKKIPVNINIKSDYVRSDGEMYSVCSKNKEVMNLLPPMK